MALGPRLKVWILLRICSIVNVCMCAKHLSRAEVIVDKMTLNNTARIQDSQPHIRFFSETPSSIISDNLYCLQLW
jgi:hypothetical protein